MRLVNKLSIGILTHNEGQYVQNLFECVIGYIKNNTHNIDFEIVIVDDFSDEEITLSALEWIQQQNVDVRVFKRALDDNFGKQKNFLNEQCTGDWIFNLDADELVYHELIDTLLEVIELNPDIEAYWIPRINTVDGITEQHYIDYKWAPFKFDDYINTKELDINSDEYKFLRKIQFIIEEKPLSSDKVLATFYMPIHGWPDRQLRLFKNDPAIRWKDEVHESIVGHKTFTDFPAIPRLSIQHHKEIRRQEKQQEKYARIQKNNKP